MSKFIESLQEEADEQRQAWRDRASTIARLLAEQQRQRVYIEQLNPVLAAHGIAPVEVTDKPARSSGRGFAQPGNRPDANMPPRREAFRVKTLPEAILATLTDGRPMHSKEMVPYIYEVSSAEKELFHNAHRSLVGTLADGAKNGRWERTAPSTYRLNKANGNGRLQNAAAEAARVN